MSKISENGLLAPENILCAELMEFFIRPPTWIIIMKGFFKFIKICNLIFRHMNDSFISMILYLKLKSRSFLKNFKDKSIILSQLPKSWLPKLKGKSDKCFKSRLPFGYLGNHFCLPKVTIKITLKNSPYTIS